MHTAEAGHNERNSAPSFTAPLMDYRSMTSYPKRSKNDLAVSVSNIRRSMPACRESFSTRATSC